MDEFRETPADFWTVPFGGAVVAALVLGGVTYRPDIVRTRVVAAGSLTGSSAALLYSLLLGQSPLTQVIITTLVGFAIAGILIAALESYWSNKGGALAR